MTESAAAFEPEDKELAEIGSELASVVKNLYGGRALRIRAVDGGSSNGEEIIWNPSLHNGLPTAAHTGSWIAYLGDLPNEVSRVYQSIAVDPNMRVTFWYWLNSEETTCGNDVAYVFFNGNVLQSWNLCNSTDTGGWVQGIQEKTPYTQNPMSEYASSGTYYFASAALMREAFEATVAQRLEVNGEYYVSLAYRPLLERGHRVAVYALQHFMQWGTPGDLQEYQRWSAAFARMAGLDGG